MSQPRASLAKKPLHLLHTFVSWQLAQMCLRLGKSRSLSNSRCRSYSNSSSFMVFWFIVVNLLDPMMDTGSTCDSIELVQLGGGLLGLLSGVEHIDHLAHTAIVPAYTDTVFHASRSSSSSLRSSI